MFLFGYEEEDITFLETPINCYQILLCYAQESCTMELFIILFSLNLWKNVPKNV
jgi:hypothetical protein